MCVRVRVVTGQAGSLSARPGHRGLVVDGGEAGWRVTAERPGGAHQQDGGIHRADLLGHEQESATATQTTKNTNIN